MFHVSKTKERAATTSTVKLKNCMQEAAKKSVKRQQNDFKHTARQGKRGVARGKGHLKNDPGPTFFSMKKKIFSVQKCTIYLLLFIENLNALKE